MRLSRRQYAAHRGVSHTAVGKAIASGRITLEPDGTIDPARADRQWDNRTDPAKLPKRRAKNRQPAAGAMGSVTNEAPVAAPKSDPEPNPVTGDGDISLDGGTSFQQARLAHEVVKTRTANVRLARLKGTLVERDRATALVFRLAREERDAWVTWPARVAALMAVELGVETAVMQKVLESHVHTHLEELADVRIVL